MFIIILFSSFYFLFIFYFYRGWKRSIVFFPSENPIDFYTTILIPFRNEEKNIAMVMKSINVQIFDKSKFEVLWIDDFSTDRSIEILRNYIDKSNQRIISLSDSIDLRYSNTNNKKRAITEGVESSKGELIICLDADTFFGKEWLSTMVQYHKDLQKNFYGGVVLYPPQEGFFRQFLEVDQINNVAIALSTISQGNPTMINGANMAFTKEIFRQVNGYKGIENVVSGDDMMLMHRVAAYDRSQIGFVHHPKSNVFTLPLDTLSEFIHQRTRWFAKTFSYENKSATIAALIGFCINLFLIYCLIASNFGNVNSLIFLFVKIASDTFFLNKVLRKIGRPSLTYYLPFFSITFSIYVVGVGVLALIYPYKWKTENQ
jgi:cellulose synthase/poly-beta-1,6-N-acetylglucosamine synthase-like glycosyltransferase